MASHNPSLGIAILGAGLFAKEAHLPALADLRDYTVLRAVYSRSKKSAAELAKDAESILGLKDLAIYSEDSEGLDVLLARSDIKAVIVALPITAQPDVIRKALAAGKHVLSEKPVAATVADAHKLIADYEASYKGKLIWRVAENFEAEPGYRAAGKAIRDGKIGKVIGFGLRGIGKLDQSSKWYKTPWRTIPDYQGGFLLDGGVHSAAVLRVVLPSPLTHLSGFASLNKDYLAPQDTIFSILKCADGTQGSFDLSFASPANSLGEKVNGTFVSGEKGWLQIENAKNDAGKGIIRTTIHKVSGTEGEHEETEVIDVLGSGVRSEIQSFLFAIVGEDDGLGLGEPREALKDVAVIQAALNSNGNLVELASL
ncbi:NAD-binding protein [Sistotremastrum niveocremeum HHB9708]|uniref:NAD-binding protein n=1 Tax=Sistotremastrum niveocremeum HHB9708 TaxID=1314777 RepID=A0A164NUD2_9AGAM|nr:NAD-binding protein [Sistotremastrum niveocremeum HHB9708]